MNKTDLIAKVSEKTEITKKDVERMLNATLETVQEEVQAGEQIQIIGFGTMKAVDKKATTARNPKTGETIKVPAKRVPKFVPGAAFKELVNTKPKKSKKK